MKDIVRMINGMERPLTRDFSLHKHKKNSEHLLKFPLQSTDVKISALGFLSNRVIVSIVERCFSNKKNKTKTTDFFTELWPACFSVFSRNVRERKWLDAVFRLYRTKLYGKFLKWKRGFFGLPNFILDFCQKIRLHSKVKSNKKMLFSGGQTSRKSKNIAVINFEERCGLENFHSPPIQHTSRIVRCGIWFKILNPKIATILHVWPHTNCGVTDALRGFSLVLEIDRISLKGVVLALMLSFSQPLSKCTTNSRVCGKPGTSGVVSVEPRLEMLCDTWLPVWRAHFERKYFFHAFQHPNEKNQSKRIRKCH